MLESVKKMGKRGIWLLVAVVLIALLIVFVYPQVKAIRLQSRAGEIIEEYVAQVQKEQPQMAVGNFYCIIPVLQSGSLEGNNLDQAILWLNEARSLAPNNVHSSFLLGQAYCLNEEYEQAVEILNEFLILRPANQLARAEIGFAYTSMARSTTDPEVAKTYQSTSLQYLEKAGFSEKSFVDLGNAAFKQERYQDALVWYEVGESHIEQQNSLLFRDALLQLVLQGSSPDSDQIKDEMIFELDTELTIEPTDFFIFSSGASVQTRAEAGQTIGTLYANSQDAGIILNVSEAKKFCISGQVLDRPPAPTQIGVDIDFETLKVLDLVNGDGDWVQFDFDVTFDQGLHVLGIKLMNDAYVGGVDRNAHFGSVIIEECQGN